MPAEKVREIARLGGKAAQARGTAHRWTVIEARAAGQKGGRVRWIKRIVPDACELFAAMPRLLGEGGS